MANWECPFKILVSATGIGAILAGGVDYHIAFAYFSNSIGWLIYLIILGIISQLLGLFLLSIRDIKDSH